MLIIRVRQAVTRQLAVHRSNDEIFLPVPLQRVHKNVQNWPLL